MPDQDNGPQEVTPASFKDSRYQPDADKVDLSEAKEVTPFQIIDRGEDTVNTSGRVTFADFSPKVLPSEAPDEELVPKDVSAPAPAQSSESTQTTEQKKSEKNAQSAADKADGTSANG